MIFFISKILENQIKWYQFDVKVKILALQINKNCLNFKARILAEERNCFVMSTIARLVTKKLVFVKILIHFVWLYSGSPILFFI